jgi:hypothetical protein
MQQVSFERTQPSVPTDKIGVGQRLLHAVVVKHETFAQFRDVDFAIGWHLGTPLRHQHVGMRRS